MMVWLRTSPYRTQIRTYNTEREKSKNPFFYVERSTKFCILKPFSSLVIQSIIVQYHNCNQMNLRFLVFSPPVIGSYIFSLVSKFPLCLNCAPVQDWKDFRADERHLGRDSFKSSFCLAGKVHFCWDVSNLNIFFSNC